MSFEFEPEENPMKVFASTVAVALFAATGAFAQTAPTPTPDCKTGDLNCATPMNKDNEAPVGSGRSSTEVGVKGGAMDNAGGSMSAPKSGVETEGSAKEIKKEGASPNEGNSNK
jgi:hypothetical protein